jgi:hypothetical protein
VAQRAKLQAETDEELSKRGLIGQLPVRLSRLRLTILPRRSIVKSSVLQSVRNLRRRRSPLRKLASINFEKRMK